VGTGGDDAAARDDGFAGGWEQAETIEPRETMGSLGVGTRGNNRAAGDDGFAGGWEQAEIIEPRETMDSLGVSRYR